MNSTTQPIDGLVGVMPAPNYLCSRGHRVFVADGAGLERCPRVGCKGTLKRVGIGSRSAGSKVATWEQDDAAAPRRRSGTASSHGEEAT